MDTSVNLDLTYYHKRIEEFDRLASSIKSETMIQLLNTAKSRSKLSVEILSQVQQMTIDYLSKQEEKNKIRLGEIEDYLGLYNEKLEELKHLEISKDFKTSLYKFYADTLNYVETRIKSEADIHSLLINTFTLCSQRLTETLLGLIFKPAKGKFRYETIVDVINYLTTKFIPGLEEVNILSHVSVKNKQKVFARSGDKILIYLEQYIDVVQRWEYLATSYIKLVTD